MNQTRVFSIISIIVLAFTLFVLRDLTYDSRKQNCEDPLLSQSDYYTFAGFGIQIAKYDNDTKSYLDVRNSNIDLFVCKNQLEVPGSFYPNNTVSSILFLRTSQINKTPELSKISELPYQGIIIFCDEKWEHDGISCDKDKFSSTHENQNILVGKKENINTGYIEDGEKRYFILPENLLTNILRYPALLSLISGISASQHMERLQTSNTTEIAQQGGISFISGAIIFIFILNLSVIYALNYLNKKLNFHSDIVKKLIPIGPLIVTLLGLNYLSGARANVEGVLNRIIGIRANTLPNLFWFISLSLLLCLIFYIGYEFNIFLDKYKGRFIHTLSNRLNINFIRLAIISIFLYVLFLLTRNTLFTFPINASNALVLSGLLYFLYINADNRPNNRIFNIRFLDKYISHKHQILLFKVAFMALAIVASIFIYSKSQSRIYVKNKILFEPPKEYITTPYSKLIRDYEVFHEYDVETNDSLFINDYIISHPSYNQIRYQYDGTIRIEQPFGYLESDEYKVIKPILNDEIQKSLETNEPSAYFKILNKNDLNSKIDIDAKFKCTNEINSNLDLQRFRLSYDKKDVINSKNTLFTKRKCSYGEEFSVKLTMDLKDISTYAYNDEILKLGSSNRLLDIKLTSNNPIVKIQYLDLKKDDNYIYHYGKDRRDLLILSNEENANDLVFIKKEGKLDLGESLNILRRKNLIPNIITINSLNKYTLVKYIK